jgi:predicted anti-sigma-YlaC factor YlaD
MRCDRFREAISARIDGEDPGLPDDVLDAHLEACADCRAWQQRAHAVTRHARLGGDFLDHDLTPRVLAAIPAATASRWRPVVPRAGLAALAAAQFAITFPLLILGHDHGAGTHAAHELGSFDLSLAIAFAVGAIRPLLSAGLAWPCGIAAAGLAGTAIMDMANGQTPGADEAQHLVALAGALLLIWQARRNKGTLARAMADDRREETVTWLSGPEKGTIETDMPDASGQDDFPDFSGGGAAQAPDPDVAARTGGYGPLPVSQGGVTPLGGAETTEASQNAGKARRGDEEEVA